MAEHLSGEGSLLWQQGGYLGCWLSRSQKSLPEKLGPGAAASGEDRLTLLDCLEKEVMQMYITHKKGPA